MLTYRPADPRVPSTGRLTSDSPCCASGTGAARVESSATNREHGRAWAGLAVRGEMFYAEISPSLVFLPLLTTLFSIGDKVRPVRST